MFCAISILRIAPNQIVGLVGGTGAGKSTLLSLVPRFYDPTTGSVMLDGRDVREITKKSLRAQIAIVLQDTLLFSTTVRENIAYGRPDATEEEIIEAARRAQADEFIRQMPQGYDSLVGERGGHLSVGQRQRIGIARAFLKNAPILLLDEPTSALDPTTEAAIMETIKELMRGRTTLIATHRLATIHDLDQIIVLEHGRIVEQGRGPELIARGGVYAKLYASGKFPQSRVMSNVQRRSTRRRRLVAGADPAERRIWRRILLRDRANFSISPKQKTARGRHRQTCFMLRRLFVCRSARMANARSAISRCSMAR